MDSIEDVGASAGKRAADLYKARERDGTHEGIRSALPDAIEAAKVEAAKFRDSDNEDERAVSVYWSSYAAAFEAGIKN